MTTLWDSRCTLLKTYGVPLILRVVATRTCVSFLHLGPEIKPGFNGVPTLPRNGPIYARAFFPHCLTCFVVGWAKLQVSLEHPHYNCKKQREHEKVLTPSLHSIGSCRIALPSVLR